MDIIGGKKTFPTKDITIITLQNSSFPTLSGSYQKIIIRHHRHRYHRRHSTFLVAHTRRPKASKGAQALGINGRASN